MGGWGLRLSQEFHPCPDLTVLTIAMESQKNREAAAPLQSINPIQVVYNPFKSGGRCNLTEAITKPTHRF